MNTLGCMLRLTTFGESHGPAIGGVLDGCPAGLALEMEQIQTELNRRKPGQSRIASQRREDDQVEFLSGIFEGRTTGAPIGFHIRNTNTRPADYDWLKENYRPGHADYTYEAKYGLRDYRGGGRSSARETANWVVGGAIARQFLALQGIRVAAWVRAVGELEWPGDYRVLNSGSLETRWENEVRCPDAMMAERMFALIDQVRKEGDSIGGVIECVATGLPPGLGEPVFDKLPARLAQAMMGINAAKGFEMGDGFAGARRRGSQHNDLLTKDGDSVAFQTNHAGGTLGGISSGAGLVFRTAFKPVSTIMQLQPSLNRAGEGVTLEPRGRHDPCVVPRAVPIVEALACLVLADFVLLARGNRV